MNNTIFTGSGVAIVTPMNTDGSINFDRLGELIELQISSGTDAIIVCGTTGEASTMTDEEHLETIRYTVLKTAKRVPVIAGTGSNDTAYAAELSAEAEKAGADAVLVVSPYYNKASQKGLYLHFKTIADAVSIPVMIYNIPSRTGVNVSIQTFKKLEKHPNIIAVKESGGDINFVTQLLHECSLDVYSGDDYMTVPFMSLGAKGVISVAANIIPVEMHEMCDLCLKNDFLTAGKLQLKYSRLRDALFIDVNPIPVKQALNLMGKETGECRLPLCSMEQPQIDALETEMKKIGLI